MTVLRLLISMELYINQRDTIASPKTRDSSLNSSNALYARSAFNFITETHDKEKARLKRVRRPRLLRLLTGGRKAKVSVAEVLFVWKEDLRQACSGGRDKLSRCLSFKSLPQVSHGFGADQ